MKIKYEKPQYQLSKLQSLDIITASRFEINGDEENNKVDYIVSPDSIFGF